MRWYHILLENIFFKFKEIKYQLQIVKATDTKENQNQATVYVIYQSSYSPNCFSQEPTAKGNNRVNRHDDLEWQTRSDLLD